MFGKTESTIIPSYGKASILNEFYQFLYDISTKKMMKRDMIASTIAKTPITDKYLSLSIFSMRTAGASKSETMIIMNHSEM
jgi:hypothetical protein